MQDVQGHSPLATGLALLPGAVLSAVMSRYAAPALVARVGLRAAAVGGMLLVSAGFAGLLAITVDASSRVVAFAPGLALVAGAVAARLGEARDPQALVEALRVGVVVGALLALLGAVIALVGLRGERSG